MQNSPPAVTEKSPPLLLRRERECQPRDSWRDGPSDRRSSHARRCQWSVGSDGKSCAVWRWTGGVGIAELARQFGLDRKTVRRCVREPAWRPYQRPARAGTLLAAHAAHLRDRAPQVGYSAQILFQELRQHGYTGSYETVKLFVRPLRAAQRSGELTLRRFETPPGQQSQVDWGTATIPFRQQRQVRHVFVLTLGFSRRSYYHMCSNETLPQFLDAHER